MDVWISMTKMLLIQTRSHTCCCGLVAGNDAAVAVGGGGEGACYFGDAMMRQAEARLHWCWPCVRMIVDVVWVEVALDSCHATKIDGVERMEATAVTDELVKDVVVANDVDASLFDAVGQGQG